MREVLVDLGFVTEDALTAFLAKSSGFDVFDPKHTLIDGDALMLMDKATAQKHQVLPVSLTRDEAVIAMADPYDIMAMDALRRLVPKGVTIKTQVATPSVLSEAIDAAYGYASSISAIMKELEEGKAPDLANIKENEV